MADIFRRHSGGLESPGLHAAEVLPDDGTDLAYTSRALHVGIGGDVRLTMAGGETVTIRNVAAGMLPIRVQRVFATGTTAGDIVALW